MAKKRAGDFHGVLERLRRADLEKIADRESINESHRSIRHAIHISVEILPEDERQRFAELSVFTTERTVPEAAVHTLWSRTGELGDLDAQDLLINLAERSLVQLDQQTDSNGRIRRLFRLHDLVHDYAQRTAGETAALHRRLLDAYRVRCPTGWPGGPDDGYFFYYLCDHLHAAGLDHEIEQTLMQFPWIKAKVQATDVGALLSDYENLHPPGASELGVLLSALRMAAPVVRSPSDLAGQVYAHLLARQSEAIRSFLTSISVGSPWLRPLNLALRQAGDPLLGTYRPLPGNIVAINALSDGSRVVSVSRDGTVTLLDLDDGNAVSSSRVFGTRVPLPDYRHPKDRILGEETWPRYSVAIPSILLPANSDTIISVSGHVPSSPYSRGSGAARIWTLKNFAPIFAIDGITAATVSADGRLLITAEDMNLTLHDLASGATVRKISNAGHNISLILAMEDHERVMLVCNEGHHHFIRIFNLTAEQLDRDFSDGYHDDASWVSWSSYGDADVGGRYVVHKDRAINAFALTHDEKYVIAASRDGTLRVWNVQEGRILHTLTGHSDSVNAVAVIPGTMYALSASSDKTLKLWDIREGRHVRTLMGHSGEVYDVVITSDGRRAVSAEKELLFVWDLDFTEQEDTYLSFQKQIIQELRLHWQTCNTRNPYVSDGGLPYEVTRFLLRPQTGQVVLIDRPRWAIRDSGTTPSKASLILLCELSSGATSEILCAVNDTIEAAAITPDGRYLVYGGSGNTLKVSMIEADGLGSTLWNHSSAVTAIAITPDGQRVFFGSSDGGLSLLDLDGRSQIRALGGHNGAVTAVAITSDGSCALSASVDGTLGLWHLKRCERVRLFYGHGGAVTDVCLTPDGRYAISGFADGTLKCWSLTGKEADVVLAGHGAEVRSVAVTPDGRRAFSAGVDASIKVWNLQQRKLCQNLKGHLGAVRRVAVLPSGKHLISAGAVRDGNYVLAWNVDVKKPTANLMWHYDSITAVAITRDGTRAVSASADKTLKVWDLKERMPLHVLAGHDGKVLAVTITPDGLHAVSGSGGYRDNSLIVWNLEDGNATSRFSGHTSLFGSINAVAITPDGERVISASADETLKVWNVGDGRELRRLDGHSAYVNGVAVTPDGALAISAAADSTLRVWNVESGREVHTLIGHAAYVNAVAVMPDGVRAVSASADKTLKVWDLRSGTEIHTLRGHSSYVNAVATMEGSGYIVSASADRCLKLWNMETAEELTSFEAEAGLICCATAGDGTILAGDEVGWLYVLQLAEEAPALSRRGSRTGPLH
jgi:WD40 repeat protein